MLSSCGDGWLFGNLSLCQSSNFHRQRNSFSSFSGFHAPHQQSHNSCFNPSSPIAGLSEKSSIFSLTSVCAGAVGGNMESVNVNKCGYCLNQLSRAVNEQSEYWYCLNDGCHATEIRSLIPNLFPG